MEPRTSSQCGKSMTNCLYVMRPSAATGHQPTETPSTGELPSALLPASSFCAVVPPRDTSGSGSTRNKLLLISFDGFRWDYDRDVDTPNLDKMAQDGAKAEYVTPPFLTITSPTHFTLLTGRYIENHGVIHNMWFNTTTQEKKQYYMTQFVDSYWDNGSLPIWITAQRQGLKAGSLHFPGTAATYKGETVRVRQVEPRFYDHSNETEWRLNIDKVIGEWFHQQDLDFVSLYFGEPDKTGHKYGPDSPERRAMVQQVDRTVGYIRDKIQDHGLTDQLNIIITADHGMTTVLRDGLVEEIILSKIPGFDFRDIKFHLVDYGPTGMLLPKEGKLEKVYQALKGSHPHLHVYKKEEMPARLHYSSHPRLLPIILFADPGYVINGFFPVQFNKGEHGFDNHVMDMKPFFRVVGPDFQKNLVFRPFETVNVYPLMCHLLGINPEMNDGHLDNTKGMLVPKKNGNNNNPEMNTQLKVVIGLSAVTGFLVLVFIVTTSYAWSPPQDPELRSVFTGSTRNKLLLISFDGFRWDYDRDVETPHLDKMAQDGVKAAYVTPPFLTITSPAHFTLLTVLPELITTLVKTYSQDLQLCFTTADFTTAWQHLDVGIMAGCTVSPSAFTMAMEVIIRASKWVVGGERTRDGLRLPPIRAYMDDMTTLTTTAACTKRLLGKLQKNINWAQMKIKPSKSQSISIVKGVLTGAKFCIGEEPIPIVSE
ncbi:ectonucleotide pyrophosphatase/phosphodiesterase family member 7-like [Epinephelus moara]|uniref:ectonucleotide pyrophosphatase/phosphodiesterase family member 7-like n=1 Tax=Epinephelus moara TaxID=300413 RepID=UPI00214F3657|nr:ectonucleotide pyrophosphatase/phosphodiesterase family member 7-like [Epinephelus moara]